MNSADFQNTPEAKWKRSPEFFWCKLIEAKKSHMILLSTLNLKFWCWSYVEKLKEEEIEIIKLFMKFQADNVLVNGAADGG